MSKDAPKRSPVRLIARDGQRLDAVDPIRDRLNDLGRLHEFSFSLKSRVGLVVRMLVLRAIVNIRSRQARKERGGQCR